MTDRVNEDIDFSKVGIAVGHATDFIGATGLTVIRGIDGPLRAGVAIVGRATGSRELHAASADHLVGGRVDAILLTGGSAYGLDAAAGVMQWMEEHGRGFPVGVGIVPIIPAAVIFDLSPLGRPDARPTARMAYDATQSATSIGVAEGSVGVGTGATVGKILGSTGAMKGGFGYAVERGVDDAVTVAALVVVNALGDVRDASGAIIAGARTDTGFADTMGLLQGGPWPMVRRFDDTALQNTTLAVVAVSRPVAAHQLTQLARAASAALFRRITPCGSSLDGDIVFAVSPTEGETQSAAMEPMLLEALAVSALERAIERAVRLARGRDGVPGLADNSDDRNNNGDHGN